MPQNEAQWAMFLFFAVGAMGGILSLIDRVLNIIDMVKTRRHVGVAIKSRMD